MKVLGMQQKKQTYSAKASEIKQKWHIIDAKGQTLGRLATATAILLRGKHKPTYSPHLDDGDFVVLCHIAFQIIRTKMPRLALSVPLGKVILPEPCHKSSKKSCRHQTWSRKATCRSPLRAGLRDGAGPPILISWT